MPPQLQHQLGHPLRIAAIVIAIFVVLVGGAYAFSAATGLSDSDRASAKGSHFSMESRPTTRTLSAGETASFALLISRDHPGVPPSDRKWPYRSRFLFSVDGPLPEGITADLLQRRSLNHDHSRVDQVRGPRATLTLASATTVPDGTYRIPIRAERADTGRLSARASVTMVVESSPETAFTIEGAIEDPLIPDSSTPLDLTLSNPTEDALTISKLDVAVDTVDAPNADVTHPCTSGDFSISQFSGGYGFSLPAGGSTSLSGLGLPPAQWPQVGMVNSASNQDGCKGASLQLGFSGASSKASR